MSISFSSLLKGGLFLNAGIYTFATVVNQALPFFLLPVLTRYLSPSEYGYVSLFQVYLTFSNILVGNSMVVQVTKNFYSKDKNFTAKLNSNIVVLLLLSTSIALVLILATTEFFGNIFNFPQKWLLTLPVLSFILTINLINTVILRCDDKAFHFGLIQISSTVLNLVLSLIFIILFNWGWQGRVAGIEIAFILVGIYSGIYFIKAGYLKLNISKKILKNLIITTAPLIISAIFIRTIEQSGKIFIDNIFSKSDVGLYTIGTLVGMIVYFIMLSFHYALEPWMYKQLSEKDQENSLVSVMKVLSLYSFAAFGIALIVSLLSGFIMSIMVGSEYQTATIFVKWIAFGYAFWACYTAMTPMIIYKEGQKILILLSGIGAALNISLNYILIQINGTVGLAQSFLVTYLVMFFFLFFHTKRLYNLEWLRAVR